MTKNIGMAAGLIAIMLAVNPVSFAQQEGDVYMWEFNEGSGLKATDNSKQFVASLGVKADATQIPGIITDTPSGKAGDYAVQITGGLVVDDRTNPVLNIQSGPITVECWLKMDGFDSWRGVLAYGASYKVGFSDNQLLFTLYGIEDVFSGVTMEADGLWHHVAYVWTPGEGVKFFVDGVLAAEVATTNAARDLQNNFLNIGSETGGSVPMLGKIDRVRVHNAVLAEADLDSVAASPKAPLAKTIVSYNFDEGKEPFQNAASAVRPAYNLTEYNAAQSAPTFNVDSPTGKTGDYSMNFDGNDRIIFTDDKDIMQFIDEDFSFEAWLKFDPAKQVSTDRFVLFAYGIGGANGYSFSIRPRVGGSLLTVTTYGIIDAHSELAIIPDDGKWHHVAAVHEMDVEFRYYVDGKLLDRMEYHDGVRFAAVYDFLIGAEAGGGLPYVGLLDRVKITRGALNEGGLDYFVPVAVSDWALF